MKYTLKEIVKDTIAEFSFYRQNNIYYTVKLPDGVYQFNIPLNDLGSATLVRSCRTITLMRYVRKSIADNTFVKVN